MSWSSKVFGLLLWKGEGIWLEALCVDLDENEYEYDRGKAERESQRTMGEEREEREKYEMETTRCSARTFSKKRISKRPAL